MQQRPSGTERCQVLASFILSIMIHFMGKTVWCIVTMYASFSRAGKCFHLDTTMCGTFHTTESLGNFGAGT
jgi:hypothetical protein